MNPRAPRSQQTMQCMEIWGGNQLVDTSVSVQGLDAWVYGKPFGGSDAGGGDVHYVSSCATGRVTRLLVADVSGHGAKVVDVAAGLRSLMRRYVNYIDQTRFITSMNRHFVRMSTDQCFATAIVTTFFAPTRSLSLCNAGHPPPLLYRAKTRTWDFLVLDDDVERTCGGDEVHNIPLGVLKVVEYEQFEVILEPGDLVLCYTDSLIESKQRGELIGLPGLLDIVRRLDVSSPAGLIPSLLATIASMHPGNLEADDVTVLLFRPTGEGGETPLRNKLLAPFRVAGGVLSSLRPGGGPAPVPELTLANIGGSMFNFLNRTRRGRRADVTAEKDAGETPAPR